MTNREFFDAVIAANINDELTAFAVEGKAKLDHTNELRKEATAKKSAEKEAEKAPIRQALVDHLSTSEPKTATMLIEEAGLEIKPQSVTSLFKPLIEDGTITKTEVKITGKGKQVGYVLA